MINSCGDIADFIIYVYYIGDFWKEYKIFRMCFNIIDENNLANVFIIFIYKKLI